MSSHGGGAGESGGGNIIMPEIASPDLGAGEPWPNDAELFQPYEVEQILLPDNAASLSVQAFLHMSNLEFAVAQRANAEHMSPSGKVPFIRAGKFIIAEMDPIVSFVNSKGISLTEDLDQTQKADMRAYMSLVTNVLGNAEAYISWVDERTLCEVTRPRHGSVYPWPLNLVLNWQKRRQVIGRLRAMGWHSKTMEEVYEEVENCCHALSERLDNHTYFFNNKPTELDALVFGHLFTLLTTPLPDSGRIVSIIKQFRNLVGLCENIDKMFFDHTALSDVNSDNFETV